jgi:flagellar hook-length control protein FliK
LAVEQAGKVSKPQAAKTKDGETEAAAAANAKAKGQAAQQEGGEQAAAALHGSKDAKAKKAAAANEEQSAGDKKPQSAADKKQQSANNGNNTGKQAEGEIQATHAAAVQPKAANTAAAKPDPTGVVKGDKADSAPQAKKPKTARDGDSPLLNQPKADAIKPPVVAKPDQAAAAVEAVAVPQVQLAKDSAKVELSAKPKTDAIGSTSATSKNSATLDRLAARAMRSGESDSTSNSPAIDKNRFVQRVEGALRAAQQRDGRIQVRLSPPELGNLRIELTVQNGVMHAKVEAETPAARNALLDNLPALRDRLAQQDIRVEKFEVDLRRDFNGSTGGGQTFDRPSGQPDSGRQEGRPRPPAPRITTVAAARPAAAATKVSDSALDVRI